MKPASDRILELAVNDLVQKHGCHTVILYGSRGRGDWTDESDYDLIGIKAEGSKFRDARVIEGRFLDAFVYPEGDIVGHERDFLQIRSGSVLMEKDGFGRRFLEKLQATFAEGPKVLPEDELQAIRVWIPKMLARIAKGDLEGNYRRSWLQFQLIEDYFKLRKKWYLGPKESFLWLAKNDPEAFALSERALQPGASLSDLRALAERVLDC